MRFLGLLMLCLVAMAARTAAASDGPLKLASPGARSGLMHFQYGRWGILRAEVSNASDRVQRALYAMHFKSMPNVQFAIPLWLPPKARLVVHIPVRPPTSDSKARPTLVESVEGQALLLDVARKSELRLDQGEITQTVRTDRPVTAILRVSGARDHSEHGAVAMRAGAGLRRFITRMAYLRPDELPYSAATWQGLDGLVISRWDPAVDAAQLKSMRHWVLSGGRLWVMLDLVDPAFMRALLRENWTGSVVDRLSLTKVCLRRHEAGDRSTWPTVAHMVRVDLNEKIFLDGNRVADGDQLTKQLTVLLANRPNDQPVHVLYQHADGLPHERQQIYEAAIKITGADSVVVERVYDEPMKMVRVVAPGWEVVHTLKGWPASLRRRYGRGWVLVTTLEPRAWIRPRGDRDRKPSAAARSTTTQPNQTEATGQDGTQVTSQPRSRPSYLPRRELKHLARWFIKPRVDTLLPDEDMRRMASEQIGYEIIRRGVIVTSLGVFVLAILAFGLWLYRRHRLEYLSVLGMILAVLVSLGLIILGRLHRQRLPLTLSNVQVIRLPAEEPCAEVNGLLAIYAPEEDEGPLSATGGAVVWPDRAGQQGEALRMVWSDLDRWTWQNLRLPSGTPRASEFRHVVPLEQPVAASITFGPKGIAGVIDAGPFQNVEDVILVTPQGRFAPRVDAKGTFVVADDDALHKADYIGSRLITPKQQRRAAVHAAIVPQLYPVARMRSVAAAERPQPTLLAWSSTLDMGFSLPQQFEHKDETLLVIPVGINRPSPGTRVRIAPAFIPFTTLGRVNQLYDPRQREWLAPNSGGSVKLRYQLPPELWPINVDSAVLSIDIRAMGRTLEVRSLRENGRHLLHRPDPAGHLTIPLPESTRETFDANGGLELQISVSKPSSGPETFSSWELRQVSLEVGGLIMEQDD